MQNITRRIPKPNQVEKILESLPNIFTNEKDIYNSRYVNIVDNTNDSEITNLSTSHFTEMLDSTTTHFETNQVKGFFITVALTQHIHLFPVLQSKGFSFHNASGDIATFVKYLPKGRKNRLPGYASHYVGVGGLVLDFETGKVLVIKEKSGHDVTGWKIPGGLVDKGEYLADAVEREVLEETGKVKFSK